MLFRPVANPGLRIHRDVWRTDNASGLAELHASSKFTAWYYSTLVLLTMTVYAAGGIDQISAVCYCITWQWDWLMCRRPRR